MRLWSRGLPTPALPHTAVGWMWLTGCRFDDHCFSIKPLNLLLPFWVVGGSQVPISSHLCARGGLHHGRVITTLQGHMETNDIGLPKIHVLDLWEGTGVLRENLCICVENMQISPERSPTGIRSEDLLAERQQLY